MLLLPLVRRGWMLRCTLLSWAEGCWNLHVMVPRMEKPHPGSLGSAHGSRLAAHVATVCACALGAGSRNGRRWVVKWDASSTSLVVLAHPHLLSHDILHRPCIIHFTTTPLPLPPDVGHDCCCCLLLSLACAADDVVTRSFSVQAPAETETERAGRLQWRRRAVFARAGQARRAGRWIWQVRRAAVLAAQGGAADKGSCGLP